MSRRRFAVADPGPSLGGGLTSRGRLRIQSPQLASPGARVHSHHALQACGAKIWPGSSLAWVLGLSVCTQ